MQFIALTGSISIGNMFSHTNPTTHPSNPQKFIKKLGIFQYEVDADATPRLAKSPLNLTPSANSLPKFKDHFPNFSGNRVMMKNKHLAAFSNACINIGANDIDICMRIIINSLEGRAATKFFEFPDKVFSTWNELTYWFKSTFGNIDNPVEHLQRFNNLTFKEGETNMAFNIQFMKLYNRILETIRPSNQPALV